MADTTTDPTTDPNAINWGALLGSALGIGGAVVANNTNQNALNTANNAQQTATNNATALQNPYLAAGQYAVPLLMSGDVGSLPGYQFSEQQGEQAINRNAAARGSFGTAGTLKDLDTFAQGNADANYGNAWNRLVNMANIGQNSANNTGNLLTSQGNSTAANALTGANSQNSLLTGAVNTLTQPNANGSNLIGGAASSIAQLYQQLFGNTGNSSYSTAPVTQQGITDSAPVDGSGQTYLPDYSDLNLTNNINSLPDYSNLNLTNPTSQGFDLSQYITPQQSY